MIILLPMPIGPSAAERSLRKVILRTPRPRLVASTVRLRLVGCGLRGVRWAQPAATDLPKTRRHDGISISAARSRVRRVRKETFRDERKTARPPMGIGRDS